MKGIFGETSSWGADTADYQHQEGSSEVSDCVIILP